jgi:hypothetical protein
MKLSRIILLFSVILFLSLGYFNSFAQTIMLGSKISFSANNITVSDALESLTRQTGIAFSYNPDQLPANRIVRVDVRNKPLLEVLNAILGSSSFGFRQMGNQIIIYKNRVEDVTEPVSENQPASQTQVNNQLQQISRTDLPVNEIKPDTVIKHIHDTVKITEYIIRTDTIYKKMETPVSRKEIFNSTSDLSKELTPLWKYDIGVIAGFFLPNARYTANPSYSEKLEQYKDAYSNNVFSGYAGVDINASYNQFTFGTGITATLFGQSLDYTFLKETGGFYRSDTLDAYYTLSATDTSWYYILDSTYIPKDNELFNYKLNNHVRYLEIPLTVRYNKAFGGMLVFGQAGIITGIFTGSTGQQIKAAEDGMFPLRDLKARRVIMSWTIAAGVALPVGSKFIFRSSLSLRSHLNSVYKEFPIETKYLALGLNAGLSYKLY